MMNPMIHGSVHEEELGSLSVELGSLSAQQHLAHHHQVYQVYQQVDQQVWMRMTTWACCIFLGPGRRCLLLGRHVGSSTSTAIILRCGKAAADIGTLSRDNGTRLDMHSLCAAHTLLIR